MTVRSFLQKKMEKCFAIGSLGQFYIVFAKCCSLVSLLILCGGFFWFFFLNFYTSLPPLSLSSVLLLRLWIERTLWNGLTEAKIFWDSLVLHLILVFLLPLFLFFTSKPVCSWFSFYYFMAGRTGERSNDLGGIYCYV